jgi:HAMP domain-containing protein
MKTIEESILEQIEKLSELDLSELLNGVREHLRKNKMIHLLKDNDDEIEELQEEIERLERKLEISEEKLEDIRNAL